MVDLLAALVDRGCLHILFRVLANLDSWDLQAAGCVSNLWHQIVFKHFWGHRLVRQIVNRNRSKGDCTQTSITLLHVTKVIGFGVRSLGLSSNEYLVWLVHLPASDKDQCVSGYEYEEWRLFQNLTRVAQHSLLEKTDGKEVTCSNAFDGLLVLGTDQGELLIYQQIEDRTSASCVSVVSANNRSVMAIAISKDKIATNGLDSLGMIAACGEDCAITVVKILASGALQISHILQGHVSRVRCLHIQGSFILSGSDDRSAKLWDTSSASQSAQLTLSGHKWPLAQVLLTEDLAVTSDCSCLRMWSLPCGSTIATFNTQGSATELHWEARLGVLLVSSSKEPTKAVSLGGSKIGDGLQPFLASFRNQSEISTAARRPTGGVEYLKHLKTGVGDPLKNGEDILDWFDVTHSNPGGFTHSRLGLSTLLQVSHDQGPLKLTLSDYLC